MTYFFCFLCLYVIFLTKERNFFLSFSFSLFFSHSLALAHFLPPTISLTVCVIKHSYIKYSEREELLFQLMYSGWWKDKSLKIQLEHRCTWYLLLIKLRSIFSNCLESGYVISWIHFTLVDRTCLNEQDVLKRNKANDFLKWENL